MNITMGKMPASLMVDDVTVYMVTKSERIDNSEGAPHVTLDVGGHQFEFTADEAEQIAAMMIVAAGAWAEPWAAQDAVGPRLAQIVDAELGPDDYWQGWAPRAEELPKHGREWVMHSSDHCPKCPKAEDPAR